MATETDRAKYSAVSRYRNGAVQCDTASIEVGGDGNSPLAPRDPVALAFIYAAALRAEKPITRELGGIQALRAWPARTLAHFITIDSNTRDRRLALWVLRERLEKIIALTD